MGLGIDYILFFYEDRNFCKKKPYLWKITDEMKQAVAGLFIGGEHLPKEWVDSLQAKDKILQIVDRFYEQYK